MKEASERHQKILNAHTEFIDRLKFGRSERLREFVENAYFYLGKHWITYDGVARAYRYQNLKAKTPTPVTNKFKALLDSVHAVLCRLEPSLAFKPGSDKDDDRLTADMGRLIIGYLEKCSNMADLKLRLSKGICLYDNMYAVSGYDPDGGDVEWVPHWMCPEHAEKTYPADKALELGGMCPEQHAEPTPLVPSPDEGEEVPKGQNYTELATPFEMWVDWTIPLMQDQPAANYRRLRTKEWVQSRWEVGDDEIEECPHDTGMSYLQSIMRLSPQGTFTGFAGGQRVENAVLVDDFFLLPCREFKKGVYTRIMNGERVLMDVDYPFHQGRDRQIGRRFLPISHYFFDDVTGAHLATGPADHLKNPQRRRNRLQAKIELHTARMANGVWWLPEGIDMKTPSGEEGTVIRGNPLAAGAAPARLEGTRLPDSVTAQIPQIDAEMEDIVGSYDILRGERPPNVVGGYALSKLEQAAKGRQTPLFLRWERSHAEWARHQFYILRTNAPDEIFFQIKGEESRWRVTQIQRADLNGGVDIDVEPGSALPQSLLEKRAGVEQALQGGLINIADPIERLKVLRELGLPQLMAAADADDEAVAREHAAVIEYARATFDEQGQLKVPPNQLPPFPVMVDVELDPHPFHFERHRLWMLSDEFRALPPDVQQMFRTAHQMQHMLIAQQQAAQQAMQQAGPEQSQNGNGGKGGGKNQGEQNAARGERKSERGAGHAGREERAEAAPA